MKVFVTGVAGQLGHDVAGELSRRGVCVLGSDIKPEGEVAPICGGAGALSYCALDITDAAAVEKAIGAFRPDAVVHCAAWTAVDAAEEPENWPKVEAINVRGTENIALSCRKHDCAMMYISTDYVFSGQGVEPWEPDCTDYQPVNRYGLSKLRGEQFVRELVRKFFIVRIAWVFGDNGSNFVKTMLRIGKDRDEIRVVNDQIGTPTYTFDLARLLADMVQTERYGTYHATNEGGYISWYDFASEIFAQAGYATRAVSVTTEEYGLSKAKRPLNSRLEKQKLIDNGFAPLPDWRDALKRYLSHQLERQA